MKDRRKAEDRRELAANLRAIRRELVSDPRYGRALCRAVLVNFRTGLVALPTIKPVSRLWWRP
jgi:hypothetical protein